MQSDATIKNQYIKTIIIAIKEVTKYHELILKANLTIKKTTKIMLQITYNTTMQEVISVIFMFHVHIIHVS